MNTYCVQGITFGDTKEGLIQDMNERVDSVRVDLEGRASTSTWGGKDGPYGKDGVYIKDLRTTATMLER